jgi:hypothetical protein
VLVPVSKFKDEFNTNLCTNTDVKSGKGKENSMLERIRLPVLKLDFLFPFDTGTDRGVIIKNLKLKLRKWYRYRC